MYSYLKIATCNSSTFVPAFEDKNEFTKALPCLLDLWQRAAFRWPLTRNIGKPPWPFDIKRMSGDVGAVWILDTVAIDWKISILNSEFWILNCEFKKTIVYTVVLCSCIRECNSCIRECSSLCSSLYSCIHECSSLCSSLYSCIRECSSLCSSLYSCIHEYSSLCSSLYRYIR